MELLLGDSKIKLKELPDSSVDSLVSDPPYGMSFMGKDWDKALPPVEIWKETLRTMKPGSFGFVMCIPRQNCLSRMIISFEDAGFNINFSPIYWTFATGFPKAHNIGKKTEEFDGAYGGFQPKPSVEVIIVVQKPMDESTFVAQALKNGKGCTWLDDCRIPYKDGNIPQAGKRTSDYFSEDGKHEPWDASNQGRFPANLLVSDDVLDDGKKAKGNGGITMRQAGTGAGLIAQYDGRTKMPEIHEGLETVRCIHDSGTCSRFFSLDAWAEKNLPFLIVPKASKAEKNKGCDDIDVNHPTIKPIKLMSYLITMGSREGDTILDPFMGSGTTGCAAALLHREFIGIEMDEHSMEIAKARIEYWSRQSLQERIF